MNVEETKRMESTEPSFSVWDQWRTEIELLSNLKILNSTFQKFAFFFFFKSYKKRIHTLNNIVEQSCYTRGEYIIII